MERAGLAKKDYTIKDIRAKAMTDASKAGYDLDELQVAGAHAEGSTTQGYIKQREVPVSLSDCCCRRLDIGCHPRTCL
ncbi:hypothetical protein B551_0222460 [Cupriavidus sp. HPC(L)]|uniref:tyrosine-type recombinase/integrase n=1 Tax=Cupriavidus sp. HPC(L) TaxID=1217418 RepID=UPI0002911037|nr:hypothetical protein B551_0222460 [Cupriavidus sp. HPC(L)]